MNTLSILRVAEKKKHERRKRKRYIRYASRLPSVRPSDLLSNATSVSLRCAAR